MRFLTEPDDLVVDIFAGSNTTGAVAQKELRRWLVFDLEPEYVVTSVLRFLPADYEKQELESILSTLEHGASLDLAAHMPQTELFVG